MVGIIYRDTENKIESIILPLFKTLAHLSSSVQCRVLDSRCPEECSEVREDAEEVN